LEGSGVALKKFLINGKKIDLEVLEECSSYFKIKIGNKIFNISMENYDITNQSLDLIINNKAMKINSLDSCDIAKDELLLYIVNYNSQVKIKSIKHEFIKSTAIEKAEKSSHLSETEYQIKSPLTGQIAKILVKENDKIQKNQTLIIIESMKMENEIRATSAGIIKNISIEEGNLVQQNQVLITLE
jgi:biotin carboxyl carrier protein